MSARQKGRDYKHWFRTTKIWGRDATISLGHEVTTIPEPHMKANPCNREGTIYVSITRSLYNFYLRVSFKTVLSPRYICQCVTPHTTPRSIFPSIYIYQLVSRKTRTHRTYIAAGKSVIRSVHSLTKIPKSRSKRDWYQKGRPPNPHKSAIMCCIVRSSQNNIKKELQHIGMRIDSRIGESEPAP